MTTIVIQYAISQESHSTGLPHVTVEGLDLPRAALKRLEEELRERWKELLRDRSPRLERFRTRIPGVHPQTDFQLTFLGPEYSRDPGLRFEARVSEMKYSTDGMQWFQRLVDEVRTLLDDFQAADGDNANLQWLTRVFDDFRERCHERSSIRDIAILMLLGALSLREQRYLELIQREDSRSRSLRRSLSNQIVSATETEANPNSLRRLPNATQPDMNKSWNIFRGFWNGNQ